MVACATNMHRRPQICQVCRLSKIVTPKLDVWYTFAYSVGMLSKNHRRNQEIALRFHKILRALHIPIVEWDIGMALYFSPVPISENSLAQIVDLPRTTIRFHIENNIRMGFMFRTETGVKICDDGRALTKVMLDEISDILSSDRIGFSEEVINMVLLAQSLSGVKKKEATDPEQLRTLQFHPIKKRVS